MVRKSVSMSGRCSISIKPKEHPSKYRSWLQIKCCRHRFQVLPRFLQSYYILRLARSSSGILLASKFIALARSILPKKPWINVLYMVDIKENGLKHQIHYMVAWQNIMVLWITLCEQMVISMSKYLLLLFAFCALLHIVIEVMNAVVLHELIGLHSRKKKFHDSVEIWVAAPLI